MSHEVVELQSLEAAIASVNIGVRKSSVDKAPGEFIFPNCSAYVVRGSLVTFDDGTELQQKQDTLYWLLFGQLAADAQNNRFTDFDSWYSVYSTTLGKTGWSLGESSSTNGMFRGTARDYALDQLQNHVSLKELKATTSALKLVYRGGLTGEATSILGRASTTPHAGIIELGVAKADKKENITLFTQTIFFSNAEEYVPSIFAALENRTSTDNKTRTDTLSKTAADRGRASLYARIESYVADNVRPVA